MTMSERRSIRACLLVLLLGAGCVSVQYVGKSYPPTTNVDLYMTADDVARPYQVIGDARAQVDTVPFTDQGQQLQEKLVAEARARGADAIILGQLASRQVGSTQQTTGQSSSKKKDGKKNTQYTENTTTSTDEVTELRGTLIKYTAAP